MILLCPGLIRGESLVRGGVEPDFLFKADDEQAGGIFFSYSVAAANQRARRHHHTADLP